MKKKTNSDLKLLSQPDVLPDHLLEAGDTIIPQDKPQLQSSEPLAQWNLPVLRWGVGANKVGATG